MTDQDKFQGIQFDAATLNQLPVPARPVSTMPVNPVPLTVPNTVTPLGSTDSVVAGLDEATSRPPVGAIPPLAPQFGFVNRLTGPLGLLNDAVAVGQHLLTGRFENAIIEGGGVAGQGAGAYVGYVLGAGAATVVTTNPVLVVGAGLLSAGYLAREGSTAGKEITTQALNEIHRTADLAPGQTVGPVASVDGVQYVSHPA